MAGQVVTQDLVEASLYSLAVVLQEEEHFRVVGSAYSFSTQASTHLREVESPNVFWLMGQTATQFCEKSSA